MCGQSRGSYVGLQDRLLSGLSRIGLVGYHGVSDRLIGEGHGRPLAAHVNPDAG